LKWLLLMTQSLTLDTIIAFLASYSTVPRALKLKPSK
jgi:hypothetical protein